MAGEGGVFTEPVLVVRRPAAGEHHVCDRHGRRLATLRRGLELEVVDGAGRAVLRVAPGSPAAVVRDAAGTEVGRIVRGDVFGRTRFVLRTAGAVRASIHADDLRGWRFTVLDDAGRELARITRAWEGLPDSLALTPRDHVLQVRRPLPAPLRALVVAAVLASEGLRPHDPR